MTAAPGKLPRLGKKDLEQLVEPFERLGCHLPKHIEKPEARIACDQHMETCTWWLMQRVLQDTHTAHVTWVQAAGETVRTARSARGNTGTRAGPNGETGEKCASLTPGSAHCAGKPRGSGWDSGRTELPNPRAPPMPSDAD